MRKSVLSRKYTKSFHHPTQPNKALDIYQPSPVYQKERVKSPKTPKQVEEAKSTMKNMLAKRFSILVSKEKSGERKKDESDSGDGMNSSIITNPELSYFERYFKDIREPRMEPVILPDSQDAFKMSKRRRVKHLFEQQAIMYGVNILDDDLDAQLEVYGNRERERMREKDKRKRRKILQHVLSDSAVVPETMDMNQQAQAV
mmetsp:Transcript_37524/g.57482  ORF Transcript_37524/g.57482 Transcript_37524/m.57482 type:complete len:201 (+) Transcript_37524:668-1270(+)